MVEQSIRRRTLYPTELLGQMKKYEIFIQTRIGTIRGLGGERSILLSYWRIYNCGLYFTPSRMDCQD